MQFLFPAPVSRRQLLIHRMLRSQIGMLFGAVIIGVFSGRVAVGMVAAADCRRRSGCCWSPARSTSPASRWRGHALAAASARMRRVAWLPVARDARRARVVGRRDRDRHRSLRCRPAAATLVAARRPRSSRPASPRVVLWPFVALVRPLFAEWPQPVSRRAGAGGARAGGHDGVGAAAATRRSRKRWPSRRAAQSAAGEDQGEATYTRAVDRRGRWRRSAGRRRRSPGRPRCRRCAWSTRRALIRVTVILFALTIVAASMGQRQRPAPPLLGAFSLAGPAFAILLAPQIVRMDLRQDLRHLELLKTWPVKAAAVVRGEMLWPAS